MLFTVSQISPDVELVFANTDKFINVYPAYHQVGELNYRNVNYSDWSVVGSQYRWVAALPGITADTVPVIQLVYSYNATQSQKQQQYAAFKSVSAVETVEGMLYLYATIPPSSSFRIRFRILNRFDLAISLNRVFGVGLSCAAEYNGLQMLMSAINPINNQIVQLMCSIPEASENAAGAMPAGIMGRIKKLEDIYDMTLSQPYRIDGYDSSAAATPISTYYADITFVQGIPASTWYKSCSIYTKTDAADFTTAYRLFYQQQATVLDLTHIYTGKVLTFSYALAANGLLQNIIGLDLLDTHSAIDISYMFAEDTALTDLDLSSWCVINLENIEGLFKNCTSLATLNVSNIDFTKVDSSDIRLIDQPDVFTGVPDSCTIQVGGQAQFQAIHEVYPNLTGLVYD